MATYLSRAALVAAILSAAACSHQGATSGASATPDASFNGGPVESNQGGRVRSTTETDMFGHTVPAPGMSTTHGGSTTQGLGAQREGFTTPE